MRLQRDADKRMIRSQSGLVEAYGLAPSPGCHVAPFIYYTASLAEAQDREGAIVDALETVEQALQSNQATPEVLVSRPDALRLRGELRLKQGQTKLAEADFREAIALAQKIGAKAWELRATMSLARLLRETGPRDEARAMLAEIYGWFTEGFDTADLKDAKALLDELEGTTDVTCSKCRTENAPDAKFCVECGESFKGRCPKCGLANPANAKFCQECGTSFGEAAEAKKPIGDETTDIRISSQHPVGEIPEGERKTVTALFADI